MRNLLILSILFFVPALALAENNQPAGTIINLSATEEIRLPNDEVAISFRIEKEGANADKIRRYVNRVSEAIQRRLKKESAVKLKTVSRNIQPVWKYPKHSQRIRTGWRMTQSGQVISSKLDAVPKWLDTIETEGAHLSSLQFRISSNTSKKARDKLRLKAIASFREQAIVIAKGLNAEHFRIIQLNASSHLPQPVIHRAEMAKSAAAPPPSLSAGESSLSITVSGTIQVPYIDFPAK
ncbi:MAG: SIMPL domain-containing protein [Mariprofundus sp.]|nr:SIMPL domain-containing protein [Mariprofundus sp.]